MDHVREKAIAEQPKLIICGASSYPRLIDYEGFRAIADEVGAYLLADISHVAGLVAGNVIPSPINHAHVTTTSSYKQLYGPRGGLILSGKRSETIGSNLSTSLFDLINKGVFPGLQGTPDFSQIAKKAVSLKIAQTSEFEQRMKRVVQLARVMADVFMEQGFKLLTSGTDTHMVVLDLSDFSQSGAAFERALEAVGIHANRNAIPGDRRPPAEGSGLRLGTNIVAYRGLTDESMRELSKCIGEFIKSTDAVKSKGNALRALVGELCKSYPLNR